MYKEEMSPGLVVPDQLREGEEPREFRDFLLLLKNTVQTELIQQLPEFEKARNKEVFITDAWVNNGYSKAFHEFFSNYAEDPDTRAALLESYTASRTKKQKEQFLNGLVTYFRQFFETHTFVAKKDNSGFEVVPREKSQLNVMASDSDEEEQINLRVLH